jgi:hypothetical protein
MTEELAEKVLLSARNVARAKALTYQPCAFTKLLPAGFFQQAVESCPCASCTTVEFFRSL